MIRDGHFSPLLTLIACAGLAMVAALVLNFAGHQGIGFWLLLTTEAPLAAYLGWRISVISHQ